MKRMASSACNSDNYQVLSLETHILLPRWEEMRPDSLGTAKHSMSCHKIAARCRTAVLTGLSDRFLRAFVSFLVNSCQFSLPTVFIKLSFLSSSTFLHLTSFRKRNQITKYGWKFVLKKTSRTLSPSKKKPQKFKCLGFMSVTKNLKLYHHLYIMLDKLCNFLKPVSPFVKWK